jgi:hypothetical protein
MIFLSSKLKDVKLAPMREVSKTLQIRWYRCPVPSEVLTADRLDSVAVSIDELGPADLRS